MIGDTVNATDAVWLSKMNDDGPNVNIEGTALSIDAVANLMANLKRTGYFKTVEMKESYQDDQVHDHAGVRFHPGLREAGAAAEIVTGTVAYGEVQ